MQRRVIIGTGIILAGSALLLFTTGLLSPRTPALPVALVVVGAYSLHRAFLPGGREVHIFTGTLFSLAGVFLVLQQSVLTRTELQSLWPVLMTFGGISLLTYGLRKGRGYRYSLVLPGAVIIVLSLVFLLFSLNLIEQSLASLTVRWWPLALIPPGLLMVLPGRRNETDAEREEPEDLEF